MALIHEKLYQSEDLASVDFGDYTESLIRNIFRSYSRDAANVELRTDIGDVSLPLDQAIPCGLIINELVCNALKYAFEGKRGLLTFSLSEAEGTHTLAVSDNGVGLPREFSVETTSTLGLRLVNTLTSQIEGELNVDATAGTTFRITFPRITD
jgi:two-component sensor histidine kinase